MILTDALGMSAPRANLFLAVSERIPFGPQDDFYGPSIQEGQDGAKSRIRTAAVHTKQDLHLM